jgi:hypothetical protein
MCRLFSRRTGGIARWSYRHLVDLVLELIVFFPRLLDVLPGRVLQPLMMDRSDRVLLLLNFPCIRGLNLIST